MPNNTRGRGKKNKTRGRLARVQNGPTQNLAGCSHRDMVPQVRKFVNYNLLPFTNASANFSIGVTAFTVTPTTGNTMGDLIQSYSSIYEQYRIRRIRIRAQVGKGYTNDRRVKSIICARVDVDNHDTVATVQNFKAIVNSENSVVKTFTERGNILLCDYRPIMFDNVYTSNAVLPVLNSQMQWYRIIEAEKHQWRGALIAAAIPEILQPGELEITLWQEIDIEFRGRINTPSVFTTANFTDREPPSSAQITFKTEM